jgi:hypothetical protein
MRKILYICLTVFIAANFLIVYGCSEKKEIKVVFDIPRLIGKNIDEVQQVLGPVGKDSIPPRGSIAEGLYAKDNQMLLITFNRHSRKVIDFFVGTDDPSGLTEDYSDLLKICHARKGSSKYSIIPVRATNDKTKFTGIIIVGK